MSFFDTEDTGGEFDMGGGNEPIPANTNVLASPDEAKWFCMDDGIYFISIRWTVLQPEEYKNRKVFQKLYVENNKPLNKDPVKAGEKARAMLAAIDKNAGGEIRKLGVKPTDEDLTRHLVNKLMVLNLQIWESEDKTASGNWINKVAPRGPGEVVQPPAKKEPEIPGFDDDVGF